MERSLKHMPIGRNWQYILRENPHVTLLRNVASVDPKNDGWILHTRNGGIHIEPTVALLLLLGFRAQQRAELETSR